MTRLATGEQHIPYGLVLLSGNLLDTLIVTVTPHEHLSVDMVDTMKSEIAHVQGDQELTPLRKIDGCVWFICIIYVNLDL